MRFTAIPNLFLNQLMPQINDIAELKTTLHVMALVYGKKGYPRFVTFSELAGDASLMSSLKETGPAEEVLSRALGMATKRGAILHLTMDLNGKPEDIYFLNTESDRQAIAKAQSGELKLPGLKAGWKQPLATEKLPNIFTLYEDNIGMLTPMIADELKAAEKLYPITWISDAVKEAVAQNKRSWRYIARILERWSAEGRSHGAHSGQVHQGQIRTRGQALREPKGPRQTQAAPAARGPVLCTLC
jgi:DnaD/phage-associated family protein